MVKQKHVSLEYGQEVIHSATKRLSATPGVYRMLGCDGEILYVGKAKSLKKRVYSYTLIEKLPNRLKRMVAETKSMEFVQTHTEVEALLLESNLIKKFKPRFNVLLRDDKSFPFIALTAQKEFPQIKKHRGAKLKDVEYFGPFASAGAVNRTITALQRAFMIRNCSDSYYNARKRPCLQYHIKRCTAPCVGYVSQLDYEDQIQGARQFLSGNNRQVQDQLIEKMQQASDNMEFELAARFRDRIRALTSIQSNQDINAHHLKDADVIGMELNEKGISCIQVFFFRGGYNCGNHAFFPKHDQDTEPDIILAAFIAQFYENKPLPREILVSHLPHEKTLLEQALNEMTGQKVTIRKPQRGEGKRIIEFASRNAKEALKRRDVESIGQKKIMDKIVELFDLDQPLQRIEVYDNSHISGEHMVGAMIVATPQGFQKKSYRKFNIKQAGKADDYGMMREVLNRRFKRAIQETETYINENPNEDHSKVSDWPDLILIDGGKGQLNVAIEVLSELNILNDVKVAAISKGPDRHAGREVIHQIDKKPLMLSAKDPILHYLQRVRDEAHRFAIGAHRQKRQKNLISSPLDDVPGIGAKRKKALLYHFGSAKEVKRAGIEDLQKVEGISKAVALKIYNYFHDKSDETF